ncbi:Pyroglutamyl-peptidase I [[Bacillus] selenitireducens MLS10]|uniref:Pyroglutamyl-peptidase I n=2 Tax=Salisediminibacterium selenitireducens TaxID=85683 RepID=D6XT69_BACIE|nr:Pyroglutamyl-peptidase I [[Bacillus] selenitireducens MLS10]
MSTVKMIVSGFEVFGGLNKNPTLDILKDLKENPPPGVDLYTIALPVEYDACFEPLESLVDDFRPDSVIALGVAAGRSSVQPERIGINIEDTGGEGRMGDNRGNTPVDRKIRGDGPDGYFSTLPNRKIIKAIREQGIPSDLSNSAGTFICNAVLYRLMDKLIREERGVPAGFIHVPATPDMVPSSSGMPSMHQADLNEAVRTAIQVIKEAEEG